MSKRKAKPAQTPMASAVAGTVAPTPPEVTPALPQVDLASVAKYKAEGTEIVQVAVRSENTVRDTLLKVLGHTPDQIAAVAIGVKEAWQLYRETIHTYALNGQGKKIAPIDRSEHMMIQATHSRQSEQLAVLKSFALYSGMDDTARAEFKAHVEINCKGYHQLVAYARKHIMIAQNKPLTRVEVAKLKEQQKELKSASFKAVEKNIAKASIEQLVKLRSEIQARIDALTPKQADTPDIISLQAARQEKVDAAASALAAVNPATVKPTKAQKQIAANEARIAKLQAELAKAQGQAQQQVAVG